MDNLLWYHLGKKRGGGGGGGSSIATRNILAQTELVGFTPNSDLGGLYSCNCYFGEDGFNAFRIVVGENYTVVWDNKEHKVTAKDASVFSPGVVLLGNGSTMGLGGEEYPFVIGWFEAGCTFMAADNLESHTVRIYQTVLNNTEVRTVGLDASKGNQIIRPSEDGKAMSETVITMPDTLIPENIAKDVDVGGIIGTLAAGGGGGQIQQFYKSVPITSTIVTNRNFTVEHNLGVVPDIVLAYCSIPTSVTGATAFMFMGSRKAVRDAGFGFPQNLIWTRWTSELKSQGYSLYIDESSSDDYPSGVLNANESIVKLWSSSFKANCTFSVYCWAGIV